jgi:hypothetical protein
MGQHATELTVPDERRSSRQMLAAVTRRRWGYIVWGVALAFIFIPEILAAIASVEKHLPFTTISAMVGHLEYENALWEIAPTVLVVFAVYSLYRLPPRDTSGGHTAEAVAARLEAGDAGPHRTAGGRLTFAPSEQTPNEFDAEPVRSVGFALRALATALVIVGVTLWAAHEWPNHGHGATNFQVGYVLYGSIAFFWLVIPSVSALFRGTDSAYPTLFRTVINLEEWLAGWGPGAVRMRIGKGLAWLVSFVLLWGLVFLLIHLTLYPFPDITHILNPSGR